VVHGLRPAATPRALAGFKRTYGTKDGIKDGTKDGTKDDGGRCGITDAFSLINQPPSMNATDQSRAVGINFPQSCGFCSRFGALKALDSVVLDL
jgi:hypothetical protein